MANLDYINAAHILDKKDHGPFTLSLEAIEELTAQEARKREYHVYKLTEGAGSDGNPETFAQFVATFQYRDAAEDYIKMAEDAEGSRRKEILERGGQALDQLETPKAVYEIREHSEILEEKAQHAREVIRWDLLPAAYSVYAVGFRTGTNKDRDVAAGVMNLLTIAVIVNKTDWSTAEFIEALQTDAVSNMAEFNIHLLNAMGAGDDLLRDILKK